MKIRSPDDLMKRVEAARAQVARDSDAPPTVLALSQARLALAEAHVAHDAAAVTVDVVEAAAAVRAALAERNDQIAAMAVGKPVYGVVAPLFCLTPPAVYAILANRRKGGAS